MEPTQEILMDRYNRRIDYVRISITDQCNLNCIYCKSCRGSEKFDQCMNKDEIINLAECFARLGVTKFKITGGEPLMRQDCAEIISALHAIPSVSSVTLTTNGTMLHSRIKRLRDAGIQAINISLDTLDRDQFKALTGADKYLDVIRAVHECVELNVPVKLNCVVLPGYNDTSLPGLVQLAKEEPVTVRFIERMPIGQVPPMNNNRIPLLFEPQFPNEKVSFKEQLINNHWYQVTSAVRTGPAVYYENKEYKGKIGLIMPMTQPFCDTCNRIRIQSNGQLRLCLGSRSAFNLLPMLRENFSQEQICSLLKQLIYEKPKRHHFTEDIEQFAECSMQSVGG